MCVSSSSCLTADCSSAMDERLLEANVALLIAVRCGFERLLVGHVVVRHDVMWEEGSVGFPVPNLNSPKLGMTDNYIEDNLATSEGPL
jgi:hypothetical protein